MQYYFSCGAKGYQFLRTKGLPLPDRTKIARHLKTIQVDFGTQWDLIRLFEMKISSLPSRDRKCCLIIDETQIQSKREYDPSTGSIIGHPTLPTGAALLAKRKDLGIDPNEPVLATHVLNVICVGLVKFWKQLVGFHLTDASYCHYHCALWIREILKVLDSIGLEVILIVHDMGPMNVAM